MKKLLNAILWYLLIPGWFPGVVLWTLYASQDLTMNDIYNIPSDIRFTIVHEVIFIAFVVEAVLRVNMIVFFTILTIALLITLYFEARRTLFIFQKIQRIRFKQMHRKMMSKA